MIRLLTGDCRDVMKGLADNSVDSIVCDPPYELTSARPGGRSEATRGKVMGGFMGMEWDATGVAFDVSMWRETLRVLKPGGLLVAFGGTRTYHRLVCAIEDAGFEVRDMLAWLYSSGFPKGTDKAKIPEAWKGWNTALKPANEGVVSFKMRPGQRRGDSGSAARFFYTAKASRFDRNDGLQGLPEKPLLWSSGEQNPGAFQSPKTKRSSPNNHPTVKPTELMRWLARLVTPPGGILLDHFCGSGSTLKAAELEGLSAIGIEKDPDSVAIARHRISADAPLFRQVHE